MSKNTFRRDKRLDGSTAIGYNSIVEKIDLKTACATVEGLPEYTTAARWLRQGMVEAEGGGGPCVAWEIGPRQIRELRTLYRLRHALSFQALRRAAANLRRLGYNPFSSGQFAVVENGELIKIADTGEAIALLKKAGQMVMIVPLAGTEAAELGASTEEVVRKH